MATPLFWLFDRFDEKKGLLHLVGAARHTQELGGADLLDVVCSEAPEKGDRILWRDPDGRAWREHEVVEISQGPNGTCHVSAEGSLCELLRDYVVSEQIAQKTPSEALERILAHTRWEPGAVEATEKVSTLVYHTNALAALRRIEELTGTEIAPEILVAGERVTTRRISLVKRRGAWRGARLDYGRNLADVERTVLDTEVVTAIYPWGKGLAILDEYGRPTGGYTRRIGIAEVNGGVAWVGDEDARLRWGRYDAARQQKVHSFGELVIPACEDPVKLLAAAKRDLAGRCSPRVSYSADASALDAETPVELGDDVRVVDSELTPPWRVTARAVLLDRVFGERIARRLEISNLKPSGWRSTGSIMVDVSGSSSSSSGAQDAADATQQALEELMARVKAMLDALGGDPATGEVPESATKQYVDAIKADLADATKRLEALERAAERDPFTGAVPALATKAYVDGRFAKLEDLSVKEF